MGPAHQQTTGLKATKRLSQGTTGKIKAGAEFDFANLFTGRKVAHHDGGLQTIKGFICTGMYLGWSLNHTLLTIHWVMLVKLRPTSRIVNKMR
jgi:hypothetical protein